MFKIYSNDLRERVVAYVEAGHSRRAVARYFDVSASFVVKLMQRYKKTGSVDPAPRGQPTGKGKLSPYHAFLAGCVERAPGYNLKGTPQSLYKVHGVTAALESVSRILKSLGFSYKKNTGGHGRWARRCTAQAS